MWCVCWQCGVGLKGSVAPGLAHGCCWEWVLGHVSATDSMRCFPEPAATFMQSSKALGRCCGSLSCCMNPAWALVKLSREAFWGLFLPSSELLSLLIQNSFRSPGWWAWVWVLSQSWVLTPLGPASMRSSALGFGAENVARNFAFCGCYQMVIK